jgi:thiol:disulfide interchange protein DsbD
MDFGYEDEVLFPIDLQSGDSLVTGTETKIAATVDWLVCSNVCLPGKADLVITLPVTAAAPPADPQTSALFSKWEKRLPQPLPAGMDATFEETATGFRVTLITGHEESVAQFFPSEQDIISNPAAQTVKPLRNGVALEINRSDAMQSVPTLLEGVVVLGNGAAYTLSARPGTPAQHSTAGTSAGMTLRIAGLALLGGMILNLMPCVFPVLFIKGLSLVESAREDQKRLRVHGLVYTAGILAAFWLIVVTLLVLRGAGRELGWGFQFQSPVFVALMALLLFFLGLSMAGQFEVGLTLTSKGGSLANRSGYAGSFFTGVLAVVVATPCTAPMMGMAIGFALAQPTLVTFAIFTALAIGLALPYLLLTLNPGWMRLLPRPGVWMEVVKQATAVPIFCTVIWLVWVLVQLTGINGLLWMQGALLLTAIAGWILGRWPARKMAAGFAVAVFALAVTLPVWAVAEFGVAAAVKQNAADAAPRWEPFTAESLAKHRAEGRAVFVDFSASWCLSCQVNERLVLRRADVEQKLLASHIVLMKADWTGRNESITQALSDLGRDGVPAYALYPATPGAPAKLLPEVLTREIVYRALGIASN